MLKSTLKMEKSMHKETMEMNSKKTESKMISLMSKKSLESSHISNAFVMVTIVLASSLLTAILMFAAGQNQQEKKRLSHRQHASYYNLTTKQMEQLKNDGRIAYQIQVKTGILSKMDGFDIVPYYASELSDKIQIAELESGKLPESYNEIAVHAGMLEKMDIKPAVGSSITFNFYDGTTETFTVSGILKSSGTIKQFTVFFSENYANNGSQLKDIPYEAHVKLYGAATMHPEDCKETIYLIGSDAGIEKEYISPSKAFIKSLSLDTQQFMLYLLVGIIILLACVLVIYGVFYLSVIGKIHHFGQLRTIGMTKRQIKKFVSHEGSALFLRSAPVGIITGGIAGYFIIPDGFSILNTFLITIFVFIVIYFITMVSVRKPANIAAAVSPIEALRYVSQDRMKKSANKKMCRVLTPLGLGIMNFSKNKKKTVITMLSLALGGILFMTAATYMSSFNKENYARQGYFKYAEFNIQYSNRAIELNENGMSGLQASALLDDKMVQEISALDGVKEVKEIKGFGVNFDYPENNEYGKSDIIYPLTNDETKDISKYLEEGSGDYEKLMSGDYILAAGNKNAEEIYGWKFAVNDSIILHYYDGNKLTEKKVTILGILLM